MYISTTTTPLLFENSLPWSTKPFFSCLNLLFQTRASTFYLILCAQAMVAFLLFSKHAQMFLPEDTLSHTSFCLQHRSACPLPLLLCAGSPAPCPCSAPGSEKRPDPLSTSCSILLDSPTLLSLFSLHFQCEIYSHFCIVLLFVFSHWKESKVNGQTSFGYFGYFEVI